jgi:ATP-dependent exoDNAse (exonuclease V) alpha subunit
VFTLSVFSGIVSRNLQPAAAAGRAAQRLQEVAQLPDLSATTIHRLLGYRGNRTAADAAATASTDGMGGDSAEVSVAEAAAPGDAFDELELGLRCEYDKQSPLPFDVVLVDEASMLTLPVAAALFNALR